MQVLNPETAQVDPGSRGVTINEVVQFEPEQSAFKGRVPDVVDADGERVAGTGTFEGGEALNLRPGDQVGLLYLGGAVANTITV